MNKTFVLNDEAVVNSYGFRLRNAGGDLSRFMKNPLMLYEHCRRDVIGRWENVRIEGTQLLADAVYDEADTLSAELQRKVAEGFMKGASVGFNPLTAEMVAGVPEVTSWELIEASLVSIPSNPSSVRLSLSAGEGNENVQLYVEQLIKRKRMEGIQLSAQAREVLSLGAGDHDESLVNSRVVELGAALSAAEEQLSAIRDERVEQLVSGAIESGRIAATDRENYLTLARANYESTAAVLQSMSARSSLAGAVTPIGKSDLMSERAAWTLSEWMKKDMTGLHALKAQDPESYAQVLAKK